VSSVVEKDFIERMIRQIAEVIGKALGFSQQGRHDDALEVLEAACPSLLGMDWAPLSSVDSGSAAMLLREPHKMKAFGQLLFEASKIHQLAGDEALARSRRQHALEMLIEGALRKRDDATDARIKELALLVPMDALSRKYRDYCTAG
jgi:hypothetical protein